ncbi:MAG: hypothetical protein J7L43_03315 [Candidatus Aenigmarchaeota archaeon]|nr:hypothetical protein [Candidatus Aenigmarchaeota archaeon]
MKGISPLISAVLLIVITITATFLVGSFIKSLTTNASQTVKNQSEQKLQCSFADFYIVNATFDCNSDCSFGNIHTLNITVINNGEVKLNFKSVSVETSSHKMYTFDTNEDVSTGEEKIISIQTTQSCNDLNHSIYKIYLGSENCPTVRDELTSDFIYYVNC